MARGKEPVKIYFYTEDGTATEYESATQAALDNGESAVTVMNCLKDKRISRNGNLYSRQPLSPQEVQDRFDEFEAKHPKKEKTKERFNNNCKEKIGNQEFAVDCSNHLVFHLERNRKARIEQLRQFITTKLHFHWMTEDRGLATLEKRFVQEILNSLQ